MQRTIISLEPEERAWLAHRAQVEHVPQTEVVCRALRLYRQKAEIQEPHSPSRSWRGAPAASDRVRMDSLLSNTCATSGMIDEELSSGFSHIERSFQRAARGDPVPVGKPRLGSHFHHHASRSADRIRPCGRGTSQSLSQPFSNSYPN